MENLAYIASPGVQYVLMIMYVLNAKILLKKQINNKMLAINVEYLIVSIVRVIILVVNVLDR